MSLDLGTEVLTPEVVDFDNFDVNDLKSYDPILDWAKENEPEKYQKLCDLLKELHDASMLSMEDAPPATKPANAPATPPPTTVIPAKFGESGTVAMVANPDGTKSYTAILTGEVQGPGKYIQLLDTLYNAKKGDTVTIKIASPGGMVETGAALFTAFENTQAKVKTVGMGTVASIASLIWMAGHEREMMPGSTLMVHGPSGMQAGKVSTIQEECAQISEYFKYMLVTLSKGILTDEQLNRVLESREDLFIPAETVNAQMRGGQQ